jgi:hypothetical protein
MVITVLFAWMMEMARHEVVVVVAVRHGFVTARGAVLVVDGMPAA